MRIMTTYAYPHGTRWWWLNYYSAIISTYCYSSPLLHQPITAPLSCWPIPFSVTVVPTNARLRQLLHQFRIVPVRCYIHPQHPQLRWAPGIWRTGGPIVSLQKKTLLVKNMLIFPLRLSSCKISYNSIATKRWFLSHNSNRTICRYIGFILYHVNRATNLVFPMNKETKRCFSVYHCFHRLPNNEKVKFLVYSEEEHAVYCFSCKLFNSSRGSLSGCGYRDWQGLTNVLSNYELSRNHITKMCKWKELCESIIKFKTDGPGNMTKLWSKQKDGG